MPSHLKELVRVRMVKTGESYQQALRHIRAQEERVGSAPAVAADERIVRSRTVADTAFSIAVDRADESRRPDGERLFVDPYASVFAAAGADAAENTQRFLELPFFREGVRLRTRYIDDCVRDGLAAGLDQVVLLGAGFDARGLRMTELASRRATVFEVDTAYQMERKRRALQSAGVKLPAHLVYVPFDFETNDLVGELGGALEMAVHPARLRVTKLPVEVAPLSVSMYWHRGVHADAGAKALRDGLLALVGADRRLKPP